MRQPNAKELAHSIKDSHPQLAIDLLQSTGYTLGAARRAILSEERGEAASLVARPATPTCKRNTA